ncbi:MAG: Gfo/Idh/MocA family oxidoreductase [Solobacterium sp.]|nr:Gfo/Idh/MocA family oxidoreductase [Solobacterium sp.]
MNIGIAGAGNIVPGFLEAAKEVEGINVKAICCTPSGTERAKSLCESYGIDTLYTDYERLLSDRNIDTVYIAVPNDFHYLFAEKALERGLHAIVEKPFVTSRDEALQLQQTAKDKKVFLFEAITTQYSPDYRKLKELVSEIGELKIVSINYSQYSSRYDRFKNGEVLPAFDPKKAGGALMDLGVYNVHFVCGLFGVPKAVRYYPNIERGIDTSGILILEYDNMKCTCIAAKDCRAPSSICIQGDRGFIYSDASSNVFDHFCLHYHSGEEERYALNDRSIEKRMYYELDAFEKMIRMNDRLSMNERLEHSINVVSILEDARKTAGLSF